MGIRASIGDRTIDGSTPTAGDFEFGTLAIPLTLLCQCLSDETLKAVGPFYMVSMPGEVMADHLSDAAYVVVTVASVPGRSALDHVKLVDIFLGMWVPYRGSIFHMWSYYSDWLNIGTFVLDIDYSAHNYLHFT